VTRDEENLRLLSIFHYIVAGISCMFMLFPAAYLVMGALLLSGRLAGTRPDPLPPIAGWIMIAVGSILMAVGLAFALLLAAGGWHLARRRRYTLCMVVAAVACAFMPFGTVLGVLTIIVLQRESVRRLFGIETPYPPVVSP